MENIPGPSVIKKRFVLTFGEKRIIAQVFKCLARDRPACSKDELIEICAEYTGTSKSSIYNILRQEKLHGEVQKPKKPPGRRKLEIDIDAKNAIRRSVHSFFFKNELPTLDKLMQIIVDNEVIPKMGRSTLAKTLRDMNFRYGKVDRKSILIESQNIIIWRENYLKDVGELRQQGRKIYYMDETWVNEGHTVKKVWQDGNVENARQAVLEGWSTGLRMPSGKGRRLIITHIGSDTGFLENGDLIFQSKTTGDYHEEMNAEVFEKWFARILEILEPNSVIVMDNAPYHSRRSEEMPKQSWRKSKLQEWLREKGIPFNERDLKPYLWKSVRAHKDKYKKYVVDEMALKQGMKVLRLPPYHCELNPIELIWAQVKGDVARENRTFKLPDVESLLRRAIAKVTGENWQNCIKHVQKIEEKMRAMDIEIDEIDPIIIRVNCDSDSNSDSESNSDSDNY